MTEENRSTPIVQDAETEAHATRGRGRNDEAAGPDEGSERESAQPGVDDDGPDVEGHRAYARSDVRLKADVRPLLG